MSENSPIVNVVSISGGKDSLATALLAFETKPNESIRLVFADTGNEHPLTLEYIDYLEGALGKKIDRVQADFRGDMERKKKYIMANWGKEGVPDKIIERAIDMLNNPTGNPFLDLCLMKGTFPSRKIKFCTTELKVLPITEYLMDIVDQERAWVWSWLGVRADESPARRWLHEWEDKGGNIGIYRPILRWTAGDVFEAARAANIKPNPLYMQGMNRVGCMPCILARKDELAEIARRFPWVIDKIRDWEMLISSVSKRGFSTFISSRDRTNREYSFEEDNIDAAIQWAMTSRGGRQFDLLKVAEIEPCSSAYGLCE